MQAIISKISILNQLKIKTQSPNITLPDYIEFKIINSTLYMEMIETERENGRVLNSVCDDNMQVDNASFEGWAICIKAWLPEMIDRVCLKWTLPASADNLHYHRFLYRVLRFREAYSWFNIDDSLNAEIETFKAKIADLTNNYGNKEPQKPQKKGEKYLEYMIVHKHSSEFKKMFNVEYFNHQLPVGVKQNGRSFFTGQGSAIDLWGVNGNAISIFELKYDNKMVGIITELFLYTCIIRDMILGTITPPNSEKCKRVCQKELYSRMSNITEIKAYMLSEIYHPLVNQQAIDLMNTNNNLSSQPKITYIPAKTPEAWLNL
jgi:hypothetical protein